MNKKPFKPSNKESKKVHKKKINTQEKVKMFTDFSNALPNFGQGLCWIIVALILLFLFWCLLIGQIDPEPFFHEAIKVLASR
ncbi:hypothetical protein ACT7CY_13340 [Bacillus pacificus]